MSSKWVRKMHGALPLNVQEEKLKEVLDNLQISYKIHEVFPSEGRTLVVDSFLPRLNVAIECWMSRSRQGTALTWLERNSTYVDFKFNKLKNLVPHLRCLGYIEAPQTDPSRLRQVIIPVMIHSDFIAFSSQELERILRRLEAMSG